MTEKSSPADSPDHDQQDEGTEDQQALPSMSPESVNLMLAALDAAGEMVLLRGRAGRVVYVNAAFIQAFGGEREDWVGRWFSVAPPNHQDGPQRYDVLMQTRNGAVWIEWDERLLPDGESVISIGRDVSSRREAHEDMAASQQSKSLFFAAVTHELRTPLAGALGIARLLETTELRSDQADYVRSMAASTEHALALIDDILDLSRLEAGKLTLRSEPFVLADVIRETVELAAPRAQEKGLEIGTVFSHDAPVRLEGDPARLKQILFNLIGNAVKFTHVGGVRVDIEMVPGAEGRKRLSISVGDTGPGIAPADQQKLFEHFERGAADRDSSEPGAGLGLAMVRRLVDAMQGELGVQSKPGAGARFWLTLDLPILQGGKSLPLLGQRLAVASGNDVLRHTLAEQLTYMGADIVAIDDPSRLAAADGRGLLLDAAWGVHAPAASASHVWLLVTPAEKHALDGELPSAVEGWMVKPIRRATLIAQITGQEQAAEDEPIAATTEPVPDEALEPVLEGLFILVAEDDPVNALIARKVLERLGARTRMVGNGPLAIQTLEDGDFDAALLDQRMPGMDGRNVAELARLSGITIPLVALTANTSEADRQSCLDSGMDDFLSKPVDPELLGETLLRLCREKKQASMGG
jgi:signal transduction histidine kinase/CheY-like chemotaxis protein